MQNKQNTFNSLFAPQSEGECKNCKALEKEFEALRLDHLKSQELCSRLQKEKEQIILDNSSSDSELKKNRQKIEQLLQENALSNEKIIKLQGNYDRATQMAQQLKEVNERIQKQKEELLFQRPSVSVTEEAKVINSLKDELRNCLKQREDALSTNTKLMIQIQELRQQKSNEVVIAPQPRESSSGKYDILKMENEQLKERITSLMGQIQRVQLELQKQQQESSREIQELQNQLQSIGSDIDNNQSNSIELKQSHQKIKQLEAQNKVLQKQLEFKQKKVEQQNDDINSQLEEIEELRTKNILSKNNDEIDYEVKYNELKQSQQKNIDIYEKSMKELNGKLMQMENVLMTSRLFIQIIEQGAQELLKVRQENQKLVQKLKEYGEYENKDEQLQQKVMIANLKKQLSDTLQQLGNVKDQQIQSEKRVNQIQEQLIVSKLRIAEMMNIAMDVGLLDRFAQIQ